MILFLLDLFNKFFFVNIPYLSKFNTSILFVFKINDKDQIVESKVYNTKDIANIKFADDKTANEIVKRGLLEKIFGGVGTQQELPTAP